MKALIFLFGILFSQVAGSRCFAEIDSLALKLDVGRLHLHRDQHDRLLDLILKSENKVLINQLLRDLSSSHLIGITNVIKRRSKNIVDALELLDRVNFESTYFFSKIMNGSKLSLVEKRAYHLLVKRQFWFEGQLYKNRVTDFLDKLSLFRFIQNKLDKLSYTEEFDRILEQLMRHHPKDILFNKAYIKESFEARIREFFKYTKNVEIAKKQINAIEKDILLLMNNTNGLAKDYYAFRYDQFQIIKKVMLNDAFSVDQFKIRNNFLFHRIPSAIVTFENISKILAYMTAFSFIVDQSLKQSFRIREVSPEDLDFNTTLDKSEIQIQDNISLEEILEEQFNSGTITYEELIESLQQID